MYTITLERYVLYILLSAFMIISMPAQAATKEQAVKAGFIYNLTKFTVWPSDTDSGNQFNLCIIGNDRLGGSLKALRGKKVNNRSLVLRRNLDSDDWHTCHIAFISSDPPEKVLKKLHQLAVLTVSDMPNFIDHGGMVGFTRNGRYVGLEVNLTAVRDASLNISAQLLKLAKRVKGLK